jgi:hypothetical protein
MAYFRADIYHHVPRWNDVRHDQSPSNTQPPDRNPKPGPPKTQLRETNMAVRNGGYPLGCLKFFS